MTQLRYRSIFISDVHLGTKDCKADYLLSFLKASESEYLYLVGDIFDLWAMKKRVYWTKTQNEILQEIVRKSMDGTKVIYIPGNHDAWFREFSGTVFYGIKLQLHAVHTTVDNRRFFVSHGDEFDVMVRHNKFLLLLGNHAYHLLLKINRFNNRLRRYLDKPYWSLSAWLKLRVNNASQYIDKFELAASQKASENAYDGYICGHIHKASIKKINHALYCNDGDWVEHCTALTEDQNGWLQLLHWSDHARVEATSRGEEVETTVIPLPVAEVFVKKKQSEVKAA